ncbi:MAG TPA: M14 family zinc carboxypeptidase, partial [Longimicrobiales bacterium]|nr:M14 family zinc carboxypeptidase [Longimicrobiales bacterium]
MPHRFVSALVAALLFASPLAAQTVPTPREHFGFDIGTDRRLANWDALTAYFERLADASPRVVVDTLGSATAGSPFVMLTITSPENHARIGELREIQARLADPRLVSSDEELARLLDDGRTVVLLTQGIHATEVGASQMSANLASELASSDDERIEEILENVILLQIPSLNPDGLQWVANWYNEHVGTRFEAAPLPWLYHFYTGHDNNRDWYAFTQAETILTVREAHNAWHPHIVHDVHQMGTTEARIFFPPYIEPWEPNVDPALTTAVNQLGAYMAADLTARGMKGVVINAMYDAFTPARAYMHYHGGARILSETASAELASPVSIPRTRLGPRRNYDSGQRSWNFPDPWEGGRWGLDDIVRYQQAGALALLTNAAKNRRYWLENFYRVGERAVSKWPSWPEAWIIPAGQENEPGIRYALRALRMAEVEVHRAETAFEADGMEFGPGSYVIPMRQPYGGFANTMLEVQHYPDLRQYPGGPPRRPYDVTAHTLGYLLGFEAVAVDEPVRARLSDPIPLPDFDFRLPEHLTGAAAPRVAIYKSWQEPMEAGWQRWVFDEHAMPYDTLHDADIRSGALGEYDVLVLQSQRPSSIIDGFRPGQVPDVFAGGLGSRGSDEVRAFVRNGGRLVAVEEATDYVADLFGLAVRDATAGWEDSDFYVPGSILRLELEPSSSLTGGMAPEVGAWYWQTSRAFEVGDPRIGVAARYGSGDPILSGWAI